MRKRGLARPSATPKCAQPHVRPPYAHPLACLQCLLHEVCAAEAAALVLKYRVAYGVRFSRTRSAGDQDDLHGEVSLCPRSLYYTPLERLSSTKYLLHALRASFGSYIPGENERRRGAKLTESGRGRANAHTSECLGLGAAPQRSARDGQGNDKPPNGWAPRSPSSHFRTCFRLEISEPTLFIK